MPSPFPGMDPYLEDPAIFPDFHDRFIAQLSEALNVLLPRPYYSGIASRVWIEESRRRIGPDIDILRPTEPFNGGPALSNGGGVAVAEAVLAEPVVVHVPVDDEIREQFLEIYAQPGGARLVATIEVLSLANKTPGSHGREPYVKKQGEILDSQVHLIEIDLLRSGVHTTAVPLDAVITNAGGFDYHACVRQFDRPDVFLVYPMWLVNPLPIIAIPLLPGDPPVAVNLQSILDRCYDTGQYNRRVHYIGDISPPMPADRRSWAEQLLRSRRAAEGEAPSSTPT